MNKYVVYGLVIGSAIAVAYAVVVLRNSFAGRARFWGDLVEKFGTSSQRYSDTNGPASVLGTMYCMDYEYVVHTSVVREGVVIRRDRLSGFELVLFPWELIKSTGRADEDRARLTFSLPKKSGLPLKFSIPWSAQLDTSRLES